MWLVRLRELLFVRQCRRAKRALVLERSRIELETLRSINDRTVLA